MMASDLAIYIYLLIYLWTEVLWFIYLVHWTWRVTNVCIIIIIIMMKESNYR